MGTISVTQLGTLTLEGPVSLLIFVMAVKIYELKIHTQSGCCGGAILVTTDSAGSDTSPPLI